MTNQKLVVVGAGPIGLETGLQAALAGYDVTVLERGRAGEAVQSWGHVRLFTPFHMNSSVAGRSAVGAETIPIGDKLLTGNEYVYRYLQPLSQSTPLAGRIREHHEVLAVSRQDIGKSDLIGKPERGMRAFQILVRNDQREEIITADVMIDCTGFISQHRWIGNGGIPAPGERQFLSAGNYRIPSVETEGLAGKAILVVGSGFSAATSVCVLDEIRQQNPRTQIYWFTRHREGQPMQPVESDPLPERGRLTSKANALVEDGRIQWIPGASINRISGTGNRMRVEHHVNDVRKELEVDRIIANPGYRPNPVPFEELQIHRCYATEGPIKLAAHLLGDSSVDCLTQQVAGVDLLKNPEPGFYILGASSYGRDSRFLMQNGIQQAADLIASLGGESA